MCVAVRGGCCGAKGWCLGSYADCLGNVGFGFGRLVADTETAETEVGVSKGERKRLMK